MSQESSREGWIQVPEYFHDGDALEVERAFDRVGIVWRRETVSTGAGPQGGTHRILLHVLAEHVQPAAMILRGLYELDDPATLEPYTGACPACGEAVQDALACPHCELSYQQPADTPLMQFVLVHGGFEEP